MTIGLLFLVMLSTLVLISCFLSEEMTHNLPRLDAESAPKNSRLYLSFVSRETLSSHYIPNVSSPCAFNIDLNAHM